MSEQAHRDTATRSLIAQGHTPDQAREVADNLTLGPFLNDDTLDTKKLTDFVGRFIATGRRRTRDFGGGRRSEIPADSGSGAHGRQEAQRRFGAQAADTRDDGAQVRFRHAEAERRFGAKRR